MTNAILDRARAHFQPERARTLRVPEWGTDGAPLVITYLPVTVNELTQLRGNLPSAPAGADAPFARAAWLVVLKARNADGDRLFADADLAELRKAADPNVLARISTQIVADVDEDAAAPVEA